MRKKGALYFFYIKTNIKITMRRIVLIVFFFLQVIGIIYSKASAKRYFSWAPFDQISVYEIKALVNGQELSAEEIQGRYNLAPIGRENRSIHHVFGVVSAYELSYGKSDRAQVKVIYQTNGKEKQEWNFNTE